MSLLLDIVGWLVDVVVSSGTWRTMLVLVVSLPAAVGAYFFVPESPRRIWIAVGAVLFGAFAAFVWEWNARDARDRAAASGQATPPRSGPPR